MTNLFALLIVTNMVRLHCPYCDVDREGLPEGVGIMYPVMHQERYEQVVTTNYLPVVAIKEEDK